MTTLLLFSLPWGYLIAALFLLAAIILFIVAIFMKDTGENDQGELEDERYEVQEGAYDTESYQETFDRYQNVAEPLGEEDNLMDIIAETSENLAETRMFKPIVDVPEPEVYEEPIEVVEVEEIKEEAPEELYEAPVSAFEAFAEPEEIEEEDADVKIAEAPVLEEPVEEEPAVEESIAEEVSKEDVDEFDEVVSPKKPLFARPAVADDEDDVPKPAAKTKSGMSFAEEVRRLIEEEERRNKNS